ncbi:hypothetical protein DOM21_14780 [Bacteriovorax stolpii]|uniref:hypothetical protein n=1 Tax=Bacteriovorax stolpii TaxID=960 RepID=UPI001159CA66|nr:hypothetical protein [Bacteriovorax stolpii]QDK42691.1 hypothetical protein DOM21_14780 [Bacteriovorax stolpii]
MKFVIGEFYKLEDIRAALGGPLLASIATRDNEILYVKFKRERLNPNLPSEIWIKNGPIQYKSAITWVKGNRSVPMFFKEPNSKDTRWKYLGLFKAKIKLKDKDVAKHTKSQDISLVLEIYE